MLDFEKAFSEARHEINAAERCISHAAGILLALGFAVSENDFGGFSLGCRDDLDNVQEVLERLQLAASKVEVACERLENGWKLAD